MKHFKSKSISVCLTSGISMTFQNITFKRLVKTVTILQSNFGSKKKKGIFTITINTLYKCSLLPVVHIYWRRGWQSWKHSWQQAHSGWDQHWQHSTHCNKQEHVVHVDWQHWWLLSEHFYIERQKKLITSSVRRSLKSTLSKLIIFWHK